MVYHNYKITGNQVTIYLNDGSNFRVKKGTCIDFNFDVNGAKKPNTAGRDIFTFVYCPKSTNNFTTAKIIPYHVKRVDTREKALESCKNDSPYTCATLLLFDGWEFKDDYPYSI